MTNRVDSDRDRRLECTKTARRWLREEPVFLDVETTGLEADDEVIEVGIVEHTGEVLMETLVQPLKPITEGARAVHGIEDEELTSAPRWDRVHETFLERIRDRTVIIYNREFDVGMIDTSAAKHDLIVDQWEPTRCAMRLYAKWCGDWSETHGDYRFQKLERAMKEFGIGSTQLHRAVDDARVARRVVQAMANYEAGLGLLGEIFNFLGGSS